MKTEKITKTYYAAHDDEVIWGIGRSEELAYADARRWLEADPSDLDCDPITESQRRDVLNGRTDWPCRDAAEEKEQ